MRRALLAVLLTGCVAETPQVFLEPGTKVNTREARLVVDITIGTWEDYAGPVSDETRQAIRDIPIYVVWDESGEQAYQAGDETALARCSLVELDGETVPYIALMSFVPYGRHLRETLPHETVHKLGHYVRGDADADHEYWRAWDVVVPEAEIRVESALEGL